MTYFTICIPVYNRPATILRTLDSIKRQEFLSYEVIIVDDGSTDDTASVIDSYINSGNDSRFKAVHKTNGGKHSALNVGIKNASGKFFIILDSDDWLTDTALFDLYRLCRQIEDDESFSGVLGKNKDADTGEMIGDPFDLRYPISSYFDLHFVMAQAKYVQDCFDVNKTELLKQYNFPEQSGMKFVPEAWLFDQLGVSYKLLLSNVIIGVKQYLDGGMTKNPDLKRDNVAGFLYHYISRIENVLKKKKMPVSLRIKLSVLSWWRYWECVAMDVNHEGPRISSVSIFGYMIKLLSPLINVLFSILYPQYSR